MSERDRHGWATVAALIGALWATGIALELTAHPFEWYTVPAVVTAALLGFCGCGELVNHALKKAFPQ